MSEKTKHLAIFDEIDPTVSAIEELRKLGVDDQNMAVISGVPYSEHMLDRPMSWTGVPILAASGFLVGVIVSLLFNWGTPLLYPLSVGGQPLLSVPPTIVLTFEFSMLGMMISTFLGVVWESYNPSFGPQDYHPSISDGRIALAFRCAEEKQTQARAALTSLGAEWDDAEEAAL